MFTRVYFKSEQISRLKYAIFFNIDKWEYIYFFSSIKRALKMLKNRAIISEASLHDRSGKLIAYKTRERKVFKLL